MKQKQQFFLFAAWLIALIATLTTLYASEFGHLPVCTLCWYQRLAIYPLVIILGMGAYKNDVSSVSYALPFPVLGFFFALYQYLEQMIPGFAPIHFCSQDVSCNVIHLQLFGFITLPLLSAFCCALIWVCLISAKRSICHQSDIHA